MSHLQSTFKSKLRPQTHNQSNKLISKQIALTQNTSNLMLLLETETANNSFIKNGYPGSKNSQNITFQCLPPKLHRAKTKSSSLPGSALPRTRIRKQSPGQWPTALTEWRLLAPLSPHSAFLLVIKGFFLNKSYFGNLHLLLWKDYASFQTLVKERRQEPFTTSTLSLITRKCQKSLLQV